MNQSQPNSYWDLRDSRRDRLFAVLNTHGVLEGLRGSWLYGDFHLSCTGQRSLSDVDLVVTSISEIKRSLLARRLTDEITEFLPMRVSIHKEDSLQYMSLSDAVLMAIAEFIVKLRHDVPQCRVTRDYLRAKITLLLHRNTLNERYSAVANRVGGPHATRALDVKLGSSESFPLESAVTLLESLRGALPLEFGQECLVQEPTDDYIEFVEKRVRLAKTVEPWLQQYVIDKIRGYHA